MDYNLIVENFGKISRARVMVKPLTLFVGDNNSGKSYVLSLIWALHSLDSQSVFFRGMTEEIIEYREIAQKIQEFVKVRNKDEELELDIRQIVLIINELLDRNKNLLVSSIFNYERVSIGKLKIEDLDFTEVLVKVKINKSSNNYLKYGKAGKTAYYDLIPDEDVNNINIMVRFVVTDLICWILNGYGIDSGQTVFLPAARTGFVLAKDAINKMGRKKAYDTLGIHDEESVTEPFTKPILNFLDVIEELNTEDMIPDTRKHLVDWIEHEMVHGAVHYQDPKNRSIQYIPEGGTEGIPLRTSSAVITELAPLILILKYKRSLGKMCYEEPEMCLHPMLQQLMAQLIIRMVNSNISVIATTHSDLIIQHVNNMCRLKNMAGKDELMEEFRLTQEDYLDWSDVAVYQFDNKGDISEVKRIMPVKSGFLVPTFSDALSKIFEQTSCIQEVEQEREV